MMNKLRKIVGVLLALAFAALALPANATFNNDYYKLVMSAGPVSPGPQTITATITNKARFDYLRSFTIDAPSGVTITAVASASSSIPASKISLSGNKITVAGIQIPYNGSGALSITATFPATCGIDQPLAWTSTAKGGLLVNWEVFTLTSDSSLVTRLTNLGNLALAFVTPPTSVLKDAPFDVVVKQTSTTCPTTALPPVAIALASSPAFTTLGTATQNGVRTTFTGNKLGAIGPATLTASAPGYASATASLTVFTNTAVENSCSSNPSTTPPLTGTFNASCATNNITVTGFAEGFRGFNKDGTSCPAVNFNLTNNICQTVAQQDANGKLIPPNAVSFVWDQSLGAAAFTYTVTWKPEYVDPSTGLPVNARTKWCTANTATPCDTTAVLKACIGTAVAVGSIPSGQPACIAEETWATVAEADCSFLPTPSSPLACIRVTTTIIDAVDPPIIR
jgi:hypothetical protein